MSFLISCQIYYFLNHVCVTKLTIIPFPNSNCKPKAQLIEEIVVDISKDLKCVPSKDTQFLVGVDSCIRELESLLCLESTDVLMVGI